MKNHTSTGLSQLTAVCLAFAVLFSSSMFVLAAPGVKSLSAEIIVSGPNDAENPAVSLNGEQAFSGRTFQSSGVVTTSERGSAVINLGKLGRINLLPGSVLSLNLADNNISGELSAGQMKVLNAEGVTVNIKTPDNDVTSDSAQAGSLTIDVRSGVTQALAKNGAATLKNGVKAQTDPKKDDDDDRDFLFLVLIFAGVVGTTAVLLATRDNGDALTVVSPVR
jgi:hypothetical protein